MNKEVCDDSMPPSLLAPCRSRRMDTATRLWEAFEGPIVTHFFQRKPGKTLPRTGYSQATAGASPAACNFSMEVEVVARVEEQSRLGDLLQVSSNAPISRRSRHRPAPTRPRWGSLGRASVRRNGHLWGTSPMLAASLSCLIRFQVGPWSLSHQRADDLAGQGCMHSAF
jgi:hypothetical protein